jgi:hypothetical protein
MQACGRLPIVQDQDTDIEEDGGHYNITLFDAEQLQGLTVDLDVLFAYLE